MIRRSRLRLLCVLLLAALVGMQATSSTLLWMQGVKACGAEVTRQCVLDAIAEVSGPVVEQAELNEDRISTLFLQ